MMALRTWARCIDYWCEVGDGHFTNRDLKGSRGCGVLFGAAGFGLGLV
jgi:hypothetical protein